MDAAQLKSAIRTNKQQLLNHQLQLAQANLTGSQQPQQQPKTGSIPLPGER